MNRRQFVKTLAAASACCEEGLLPVLTQGRGPGLITRDSARPQLPCGVMCGDISGTRAIVWSRCDRNATMIVDYGTDHRLRHFDRIVGPTTTAHHDFTARVDIPSLQTGSDIF